ncbi:MacB-like periplasmic core domain protein [Candidatus Norongarragalina meridionalis]|nr:MacB-like periplasmic core domain protein [Candidatus Norongarragalina meridionalis]
MWDFLALGLRNISHRRTRSILTVIGIFIGIAAVVSLISLGDGLQQVVAGEFQKLGTDKITIMATAGGMMSSPMASEISANPLTDEDVSLIKRVRGVKAVAGMLMKSATLDFKSVKKSGFIYGIPTDENMKMFEDMNSIEIVQGRKFTRTDRNVIIVGSYFATDMFDKKKVKIGDVITVNNRDMRVIGIMKSVGNRMDDSSVYAPMETVRDVFSEPKLLSMIMVQTSPGAEPAEVASAIEKKMRDRRHEKEGEEDFSVSTSEQLMATFSLVFGAVQAVVIGIAAISLIVGGIGIMNTMYTSVMERTREIGIMKAIGARNSDILQIFLIESGILGLIGGLVGITIGAGIAKVAEIAAAQALGSNILKTSFTPELIIGALTFSFLIGALSGIMPARTASLMKPVDALRYE